MHQTPNSIENEHLALDAVSVISEKESAGV